MGKNHGSTEPAKWSWLVLCLGVWAGLPWLGRVSGQDQVQSLGLVSGPAAGPQRNVALAFSPAGIRYLAVWDDKRPSAFGEENIRARFIGQGADFPICEAAGEQKRPSLAPIDDGFMVFWEDRRNNSDPKGPRDIFTAKVTTGGIVQPIGGRQLSFGAADESDVEAAGNRKGTIAVWETSGPEPGLYASRTGPTGLALDATPFPVVRRQFSQPSEPDVAANDDGFMIVWESDEETRRIMGIFVKWDPGGGPQVGPEFEVGPFLEGEAEPEVIRLGDLFLVSWSYRGADEQAATIVGRRMRTDGTSPDPFAVTFASDVRAKDRSMLEYEGCVYLLTIPSKQRNSPGPSAAPYVRVIQARRICYLGVLDVGGVWDVSEQGIDDPADPAVTGGLGGGRNAWMAWEDNRNRPIGADEEIYAKPFIVAGSDRSASLISRASAPPQLRGSPLPVGDLAAWTQEGGEMAGGLVVASKSGRSWWFPASPAPVDPHPDLRRRVGAFTAVPTGIGQYAILWRNGYGILEGARLIYRAPIESLGAVTVTGPLAGAISLSSVPEHRSLQAGQLVNYRPPTAAILTDVGTGGVNCYIMVLRAEGNLEPVGIGFLPLPANSPQPSVWGIKLVASGSQIGIAVWLEDPAHGGGPAGRLWLRTGKFMDGAYRMTSEWLDQGNSHGGLAVEAAADDRGMVWVSRVQGTGPNQGMWQAQRLGWDGSRAGPFIVSSLYSGEWSMVARPNGGFLGFQGLPGGVGGGEIQVTELNPNLLPERAWRWENVPMGASLSPQPEGDAVRILSDYGGQTFPGVGQALWRPFTVQDGSWNPLTRTYTLRCAGPAGMSVEIRYGPSLSAFPSFSGGRLNPPGWPPGTEGNLEMAFPTDATPARFFKVHASWLRQVPP